MALGTEKNENIINNFSKSEGCVQMAFPLGEGRDGAE